MRLLKFRVTNFRSVTDSGWLNVSDVTALIGENEAGKTNLLLPLWKFNPTAAGEISLLDDMPRSRYAEMRNKPESYRFIYCEFELDESDIELAKSYGIEAKEGTTIIARRNFAGQYGFEFPDFPDVNFIDTFNPALEKPTENENEEPNKGPSLWVRFKNRLPHFVYYSNYGNLDDQIYLPHVVENMERKDLGQREAAKTRTLKVLFDLVNLSAEEMLELARSTGVVERVNQQGQRVGNVTNKTDDEIQEDDKQLRERLALLQSASSKLTKSFADWWKQGNYRFRLVADGNYFRILVADDRRPEEIELENRSAGLQWFLSFFLVFTYESEDTHEEAIVLLDEPGHSLHPLAQRDLTAFFNNLAKTNQLIFTTHSPFMIDADRLDRVRKVFVGEGGSTEASSDLGVTRGANGLKDKGATYAVHSALNLTVAESLLLGCQPIIVEGPSDQHYLTAIKSILISKKKIAPKLELVFPPSGGAKTAKIIASILSGRDDDLPKVLLDSDIAGKQAIKSLQDDLYSGAKDKVIETDEVFSDLKGTEIEDLLPTSLVIQVLDRMERRAEQEFEDFHDPKKPIVPQIKNWAEREGFVLEHGWKVKLALGVKDKLLSNPNRYVEERHISRWKQLFVKLL
ncbi:MAG: OLD family endonuclease [Gammaproteobacteria bacterium]|nr:OLD family endonuclease [Gammaproteobacteria bacterium]MBK82299.1 OLD family endonuclease [Gammaproteobacteria bacterium]MBK83789.1 OLD family endonuclease [Gammaproteobacteria bacterium]HCV05329.1 OLD family endonuclease [Pseudoalteromonas sp.]|tara:strand:- start:1643 stop:3526 length:1884 start_codon:yes stop_codon:yes gene_type:complete